MANSPIPDQSKQFKESGFRLITDPASDYLLSKSQEQKSECTVDLWDPATGPQEPSESCER